METAVPFLPLLNTRETAAAIREHFFKGPPATPESWSGLSYRQKITMLHRCAVRVLMADWYDWYLGKPEITADDIQKSVDTMDNAPPLWLKLGATIESLKERGYGNVVTEYLRLRGRLMGSSVAYFREFQVDADNPTDKGLCVTFIYAHLGRMADDTPKYGRLIWGAVEPADFFIMAISKVLAEVDEVTGRRITRPEFATVAETINDYNFRTSTMFKPDAMRATLCHDNLERTVKCTWEDGSLAGIDLNVPGWTPDAEVGRYIKSSNETPVRTGCPATFSKVAGVYPNNPVRAMIDWYAQAVYRGLFDGPVPVSVPVLSGCPMRRAPA